LIVNGISYELSRMRLGETDMFHINTARTYPKTLSKYYSLSKYNVDALVSSSVYINTPSQFNDLFDTLIHQIDFSLMLKEELYQIIDYMAIEPHAHDLKHRFRKDPREAVIKLVSLCSYKFDQDYGILCTTENKVNDLMWAHYSNNSGYLIEYDYKKFPPHFGSPYEINYIDSPPKFEPRTQTEFLECLLTCSLLKKSIWNYENEHRFLVVPPRDVLFEIPNNCLNEEDSIHVEPRLQKFPTSAIRKIVLGFKTFDNLIDRDSSTKKRIVVQLQSEEGELIKRLIQFSIENAIPIDWLSLETTTFTLVRRPIGISVLDGYSRIQVEYLPTSGVTYE
jgi:hypothetical protein